MGARAIRWLARGLGALAVLAAVAASSGCDWRNFDELKAKTPVLTVGPDSGFAIKGDYGRYVLPLSGPAPGATGGRYLVSAASTACIGIVDVDASGHASNSSVIADVFGHVSPVFPITSMAEVPGTREVLLGAPQAQATGAVYVMTLGTNDVRLLDSPADEDRFGLGVGAGALAGGAAADYVVVSQNRLTVYVDGDPGKAKIAPDSPADCPLDISTTLQMRDRLNRAVIVDALEGPGAPQIIVGTPTMGDMGAVSVFKVDATTGEATCDFAYRSPEGRFGHALATGDFDGDGTTDLLVGAPPGKAYWIKGPLKKDSPISAVKLGGGGSSQLGSTVGAAPIDTQAGDEALVGDPDATVDMKMAAGEVRIVASTAPSGGMVLDKELPVLRRHDPSAIEAFGAQARALPFCTAGCDSAMPTVRNLPLVGAQGATYTYFMLLPGDKDPRKP